MKTLLETLGMTIEESAEELTDYAYKDGLNEAICSDLEMMICNHIKLTPSDIEIINDSMMESDYEEGIIYHFLDDVPNVEELEADYDDFDWYYRVEGNVVKGYQYNELSELLNNGDYYEVKRFIAQKLMEEESAKKIIDLCNEMMKG